MNSKKNIQHQLNPLPRGIRNIAEARITSTGNFHGAKTETACRLLRGREHRAGCPKKLSHLMVAGPLHALTPAVVAGVHPNRTSLPRGGRSNVIARTRLAAQIVPTPYDLGFVRSVSAFPSGPALHPSLLPLTQRAGHIQKSRTQKPAAFNGLVYSQPNIGWRAKHVLKKSRRMLGLVARSVKAHVDSRELVFELDCSSI
jgi:hypothetical protein